MKRIAATLAVVLLLAALPTAARTLDIYFIDVEGGQSTLLVTPAGESILVDAGYARPDGRDVSRILTAAAVAHIERIDYLVITHFHPDHAGGVPELATRIPIGTFVDYGHPLGTAFGPDRMTVRTFAAYEPARDVAPHLHPSPGDRLPFKQLEAEVISAGGNLLKAPLGGGGQLTEGCSSLEDYEEDGTENFRSLGIRFKFGAFSFVDLGDLSGNTLQRLVCPMNPLGRVSAYLVAHHGDYDTSSPAVLAALQPQVALLDNGPRKGGAREAFQVLHQQTGTDLWQLHESLNAGAINAADDYIANLDGGDDGAWIKLSANEDGSFSVTNGRNGYSRSYPGPGHQNTAR